MDERKSGNMKEKLKNKNIDLKNMWNYIKSSNIHVIRAPKEDERENQTNSIFEKIIFNVFTI